MRRLQHEFEMEILKPSMKSVVVDVFFFFLIKTKEFHIQFWVFFSACVCLPDVNWQTKVVHFFHIGGREPPLTENRRKNIGVDAVADGVDDIFKKIVLDPDL